MTNPQCLLPELCTVLHTPLRGSSKLLETENNEPSFPLSGHWNNISIPSHIKFIQFSTRKVFLGFFLKSDINYLSALETTSHTNFWTTHCHVVYSPFIEQITNTTGTLREMEKNFMLYFYLFIINSTSLGNNRLKTYITVFSGILQINKQMSSAYLINLYKKYTEIVFLMQYWLNLNIIKLSL